MTIHDESLPPLDSRDDSASETPNENRATTAYVEQSDIDPLRSNQSPVVAAWCRNQASAIVAGSPKTTNGATG